MLVQKINSSCIQMYSSATSVYILLHIILLVSRELLCNPYSLSLTNKRYRLPYQIPFGSLSKQH